MTQEHQGGCACGAVRFVCEGAPLLVAHCHCRDCQRSSGAAFATVVVMPATAFRLLAGETASHVYRGDSGKAVTRMFCPSCGAPLFTKAEAMPDAWIVRAAAFDEPGAFTPQMHIYTASAQPWDRIADDLPRFPGMPPA